MIDLDQENGPEDEGKGDDSSLDLEIILPTYDPTTAWKMAIDRAKEGFLSSDQFGLPYHWSIRLTDVVYRACADEARTVGYCFYFDVSE